MIDMMCNTCYNTGCVCGGIGYNCDCGGEHQCNEETLIPKTREDRTVICSEVKELWNQKEIIFILESYREFAWKNGITLTDLKKFIDITF